jgi:hypothetical protein
MLGDLSVVEQRYLAVREVLTRVPRSPMWLSVGWTGERFTIGWSVTPMAVWVLRPTAVRSLTAALISSPLRCRR